MTSTPDTPNMTEAPRITEKHIEILEWVRTTEKWAPFVVDRLTDVEMLVRCIHEGSVVVVRRNAAESVADALADVAVLLASRGIPKSAAAAEALAKGIREHWLTDTTDATTRCPWCHKTDCADPSHDTEDLMRGDTDATTQEQRA